MHPQRRLATGLQWAGRAVASGAASERARERGGVRRGRAPGWPTLHMDSPCTLSRGGLTRQALARVVTRTGVASTLRRLSVDWFHLWKSIGIDRNLMCRRSRAVSRVIYIRTLRVYPDVFQGGVAHATSVALVRPRNSGLRIHAFQQLCRLLVADVAPVHAGSPPPAQAAAPRHGPEVILRYEG